MTKTKTPPDKNKTKAWEKDRRDRLNKTFEELAKLLPKYDPSVQWSKIEIIQKSIKHITNLHDKYKNYLRDKDPEILREYDELIEALQNYQIRNKQLSDLLKAASITVPAFKLPKYLLNNEQYILIKSKGKYINYKTSIKSDAATNTNTVKKGILNSSKNISTNDNCKATNIKAAEVIKITATTIAASSNPVKNINTKNVKDKLSSKNIRSSKVSNSNINNSYINSSSNVKSGSNSSSSSSNNFGAGNGNNNRIKINNNCPLMIIHKNQKPNEISSIKSYQNQQKLPPTTNSGSAVGEITKTIKINTGTPKQNGLLVSQHKKNSTTNLETTSVSVTFPPDPLSIPSISKSTSFPSVNISSNSGISKTASTTLVSIPLKEIQKFTSLPSLISSAIKTITTTASSTNKSATITSSKILLQTTDKRKLKNSTSSSLSNIKKCAFKAAETSAIAVRTTTKTMATASSSSAAVIVNPTVTSNSPLLTNHKNGLIPEFHIEKNNQAKISSQSSVECPQRPDDKVPIPALKKCHILLKKKKRRKRKLEDCIENNCANNDYTDKIASENKCVMYNDNMKKIKLNNDAKENNEIKDLLVTKNSKSFGAITDKRKVEFKVAKPTTNKIKISSLSSENKCNNNNYRNDDNKYTISSPTSFTSSTSSPLSPTAAFLLSFPVVTTSSTQSSQIVAKQQHTQSTIAPSQNFMLNNKEINKNSTSHLRNFKLKKFKFEKIQENLIDDDNDVDDNKCRTLITPKNNNNNDDNYKNSSNQIITNENTNNLSDISSQTNLFIKNSDNFISNKNMCNNQQNISLKQDKNLIKLNETKNLDLCKTSTISSSSLSSQLFSSCKIQKSSIVCNTTITTVTPICTPLPKMQSSYSNLSKTNSAVKSFNPFDISYNKLVTNSSSIAEPTWCGPNTISSIETTVHSGENSSKLTNLNSVSSFSSLSSTSDSIQNLLSFRHKKIKTLDPSTSINSSFSTTIDSKLPQKSISSSYCSSTNTLQNTSIPINTNITSSCSISKSYSTTLSHSSELLAQKSLITKQRNSSIISSNFYSKPYSIPSTTSAIHHSLTTSHTILQTPTISSQLTSAQNANMKNLTSSSTPLFYSPPGLHNHQTESKLQTLPSLPYLPPKSTSEFNSNHLPLYPLISSISEPSFIQKPSTTNSIISTTSSSNLSRQNLFNTPKSHLSSFPPSNSSSCSGSNISCKTSITISNDNHKQSPSIQNSNQSVPLAISTTEANILKQTQTPSFRNVKSKKEITSTSSSVSSNLPPLSSSSSFNSKPTSSNLPSPVSTSSSAQLTSKVTHNSNLRCTAPSPSNSKISTYSNSHNTTSTKMHTNLEFSKPSSCNVPTTLHLPSFQSYSAVPNPSKNHPETFLRNDVEKSFSGNNAFYPFTNGKPPCEVSSLPNENPKTTTVTSLCNFASSTQSKPKPITSLNFSLDSQISSSYNEFNAPCITSLPPPLFSTTLPISSSNSAQNSNPELSKHSVLPSTLTSSLNSIQSCNNSFDTTSLISNTIPQAKSQSNNKSIPTTSSSCLYSQHSMPPISSQLNSNSNFNTANVFRPPPSTDTIYSPAKNYYYPPLKMEDPTDAIYSPAKSYYYPSLKMDDPSNFSFSLTSTTMSLTDSSSSILPSNSSLVIPQSFNQCSPSKSEISWISPSIPVTSSLNQNNYKTSFTFSLTPSTTTFTNVNASLTTTTSNSTISQSVATTTSDAAEMHHKMPSKVACSLEQNQTTKVTKESTLSSFTPTTAISNTSYLSTNFTFSLTQSKDSLTNSESAIPQLNNFPYNTTQQQFNYYPRIDNQFDSINQTTNFTFALTRTSSSSCNTSVSNVALNQQQQQQQQQRSAANSLNNQYTHNPSSNLKSVSSTEEQSQNNCSNTFKKPSSHSPLSLSSSTTPKESFNQNGFQNYYNTCGSDQKSYEKISSSTSNSTTHQKVPVNWMTSTEYETPSQPPQPTQSLPPPLPSSSIIDYGVAPPTYPAQFPQPPPPSTPQSFDYNNRKNDLYYPSFANDDNYPSWSPNKMLDASHHHLNTSTSSFGSYYPIDVPFNSGDSTYPSLSIQSLDSTTNKPCSSSNGSKNMTADEKSAIISNDNSANASITSGKGFKDNNNLRAINNVPSSSSSCSQQNQQTNFFSVSQLVQDQASTAPNNGSASQENFDNSASKKISSVSTSASSNKSTKPDAKKIINDNRNNSSATYSVATESNIANEVTRGGNSSAITSISNNYSTEALLTKKEKIVRDYTTNVSNSDYFNNFTAYPTSSVPTNNDNFDPNYFYNYPSTTNPSNCLPSLSTDADFLGSSLNYHCDTSNNYAKLNLKSSPKIPSTNTTNPILAPPAPSTLPSHPVPPHPPPPPNFVPYDATATAPPYYPVPLGVNSPLIPGTTVPSCDPYGGYGIGNFQTSAPPSSSSTWLNNSENDSTTIKLNNHQQLNQQNPPYHHHPYQDPLHYHHQQQNNILPVPSLTELNGNHLPLLSNNIRSTSNTTTNNSNQQQQQQQIASNSNGPSSAATVPHTAGNNLTNFNLTTICPEINNEKVGGPNPW